MWRDTINTVSVCVGLSVGVIVAILAVFVENHERRLKTSDSLHTQLEKQVENLTIENEKLTGNERKLIELDALSTHLEQQVENLTKEIFHEPTPLCDKGWILFEKSCYYFSTPEVSFKDAMVACYNFGAKLLEIKDLQEEKWVDLQCRLRGYIHGTWLGFSDIQNEGQFVSLTDAREPRYANWMKGQPDNGGKAEDCAMYWTAYKGWNDSRCTSKINYACKK